ncbi:siderophore-interacting protein [Advenella sp. RU8]|uniref:siderophore-interacting protein n=1 Tax=Advenella sp. RU8 TaxID=3399575 RepID=UPI003AB0EA04
MTESTLDTQKLQHPIKIRLLQVKRITPLSPSIRRITLSGNDLNGFVSASFDDHIKLFLPDLPGQKPNMPVLEEKGIKFDEHRPKPLTRDYTPRRYNPDTNELDIDFVLNHEGPATSWASQAEVGHYLGVAGPRGSFVIPAGFDWHLLMGDETAIPAIARRLEELPASCKAIVIIKIASDDSKIPLQGQCDFEVRWVQQDSDPADKNDAEMLAACLGGRRVQRYQGPA